MKLTMNNGLIVAAAVAALFSTATLAAEHNKAAELAKGKTQVKVKCLDINSCKGKSDCGQKSKNSCQGKNSCKGQGWKWVKGKSPQIVEKSCKKQGGKVMEEEVEHHDAKKK